MRLLRSLRSIPAIVAMLAVAGCASTPTSTKAGPPPNLTDLLALQAQWQAGGIADYQYDFSQGGFSHNCPGLVHVYAQGSTVDSAFVVASGEKLDASTLQLCARTIDGLFQTAVNASVSGSLKAIQIDSTYGYPTRIDLSGVPVASRFLAASELQLPSTKPGDVLRMQARWLARGITSYQYDFDQGGLFNACPRPVHVYAQGTVVDSVFILATGEKLTGTEVQFCASTIDGLFERAVSAAESGTLERIQYDPTYGYPARMDLSGPPDASGFLAASVLQPE